MSYPTPQASRTIAAINTLRLLPLIGGLCAALPAAATPILGTAQSFAVLAAATVTNTGATTLWGDLGVSPGSAITGLGSITVSGSTDQTDAIAAQAEADALGAYTQLAGLTATHAYLLPTDLGGLTLTPGVYSFASSAQISGTLTLDAQNDPSALFVFQIGSTLTTSANALVQVLHGGAGTGVFWQVGSSATLGSTTLFAGNLLAEQSITLATGAQILCGRAIALNAAVTLDGNTLSNDCSADTITTGPGDFGSAGFSADGDSVAALPEPAQMALLGTGLASLCVARSRRQMSRYAAAR
jgi:type VI secretion system secreted protein VgrG